MARFVADMMLGRLARWLRLYGHDTLYGIVDDGEIVRVAGEENRTVLTRDTGLAERAKKAGVRVVLLRSTSLPEQLLELGVGDLSPERARCPKCNGPLEAVPRERVRGRVPERVYALYGEFYVCKNCGQVYWPGRQWKALLEFARRAGL